MLSFRLRFLAAALLGAPILGCGAGAGELPDELGGRWRVVQIAGADVAAGVDISFEIDARSGAIAGDTGCNPFTGRLEGFGRAVTLSGVTEEDRACPSPEAAADEERFLRVLPAIQRYARSGAFLDLTQQQSGQAMLRLQAAESVEAR